VVLAGEGKEGLVLVNKKKQKNFLFIGVAEAV
jgi:hypothetical protein